MPPKDGLREMIRRASPLHMRWSTDPDRSPLDHDYGADRSVRAALELVLSSEPTPEPPMRPNEVVVLAGRMERARAKLDRFAAH
jgi:hypothetical protein